MTNEDLIWLAGLYEGEGYIFAKEGVRTVSLNIASTDHDVVLACQERTGLGSVTLASPAKGNRKALYRWRVMRRHDVLSLIDMLVPHMFERRSAQLLAARKVIAGKIEREPVREAKFKQGMSVSEQPR